MAANTGANLKGLRDRALLLIGFAGALRRSELVALNIEDIEEAGRRTALTPSGVAHLDPAHGQTASATIRLVGPASGFFSIFFHPV
jgi:hypothetical protein